MAFEIFPSPRGRYRYGLRHPNDPEKIAVISPGGWGSEEKAGEEARLVEGVIVNEALPALKRNLADEIARCKQARDDRDTFAKESTKRGDQIRSLQANLDGTRARIKDLVGDVQAAKADWENTVNANRVLTSQRNTARIGRTVFALIATALALALGYTQTGGTLPF